MRWPWRRAANREAEKMRAESEQALARAKKQRREAKRVSEAVSNLDVDAFTAAVERALRGTQ